MDDYELFEQELDTLRLNGDLAREISEEEKESIFDKYEIYDTYFDCGDLCWESNLAEVLGDLGLINA